MIETVRWTTNDGRIAEAYEPGLRPGRLRIVDQTRLPESLLHLELETIDETVDAIRRLAVRGAPAIGCAAALGLAAAAERIDAPNAAAFRSALAPLRDALAASRPTAVNLFHALTRCRNALADLPPDASAETAKERLLKEALDLLAEDVARCRAIGRHGAELIRDGMGILTHCNAGALATAGIGTALAPLYVAHAAGRRFRVYADETRPLLQGARLTAWELQRAGIDVVLLCDAMAADLMRAGKIDLVLVGADRIAANGDVANKIGSYGLAVWARHHRIPFYVAAPSSTFDPALESGAGIPIETRDPDEVRRCGGRLVAPKNVAVRNPAFDVVPAELVSGLVDETGIRLPPFDLRAPEASPPAAAPPTG